MSYDNEKLRELLWQAKSADAAAFVRARWEWEGTWSHNNCVPYNQWLADFLDGIRKDERERCARVCEAYAAEANPRVNTEVVRLPLSTPKREVIRRAADVGSVELIDVDGSVFMAIAGQQSRLGGDEIERELREAAARIRAGGEP